MSIYLSILVGASSTLVIFCSKIKREREIRMLVQMITIAPASMRAGTRWRQRWLMEPHAMTEHRKSPRGESILHTSSQERVTPSIIVKKKLSLTSSEIGKTTFSQGAAGFLRPWVNNSESSETLPNCTKTMNSTSLSKFWRFSRKTNTTLSSESKIHQMKCGL